MERNYTRAQLRNQPRFVIEIPYSPSLSARVCVCMRVRGQKLADLLYLPLVIRARKYWNHVEEAVAVFHCSHYCCHCCYASFSIFVAVAVAMAVAGAADAVAVDDAVTYSP